MIIIGSLRYILGRFVQALLLSYFLPHHLDPVIVFDLQIEALSRCHRSQPSLQKAVIRLRVEMQRSYIS